MAASKEALERTQAVGLRRAGRHSPGHRCGHKSEHSLSARSEIYESRAVRLQKAANKHESETIVHSWPSTHYVSRTRHRWRLQGLH
jgi:hypothetical protein